MAEPLLDRFRVYAGLHQSGGMGMTQAVVGKLRDIQIPVDHLRCAGHRPRLNEGAVLSGVYQRTFSPSPVSSIPRSSTVI